MATSFAERLRSERQRLGLSQPEVAIAGGVSRSTQAAYESGGRSPDVRYLENIATVGFDAAYLASGIRGNFVDSNWQLLAEVLEVIQEFQRESGVSIPATKQVNFVREIFAEFGADPEHAKSVARKMLSLVR